MNSKAAIKKGEEGERRVAALLDSSHSFHRLINNLVLVGENGVSHQIDHILINSNGIFVIETKNYYGEIYLERGQWKRKINNKIEKLADPLRQNKSHAITLNKILKNKYEILRFSLSQSYQLRMGHL